MIEKTFFMEVLIIYGERQFREHFRPSKSVVTRRTAGIKKRLNDLLNETPPCSKEDELERRLLKANLLSEVPPSSVDLTPYQNRKPGKTTGKPLSKVIIEERR